MMKYNSQIHHRRSIRLKGYDYSLGGAYFITICTQDRECLFGKIADGEMILNDAGKIANEFWLQIPNHFPNVILHEHIVMPNHVHGIIELAEQTTVGVQNFEPQQLQQITEKPQNKFQKIIPRSIGSIIRGYKIGVTKWFRNKHAVGVENFHPLQIQSPRRMRVWQRNYYEHIIRKEQSCQTISDYITTNPAKWNNDKFFVDRNASLHTKFTQQQT